MKRLHDDDIVLIQSIIDSLITPKEILRESSLESFRLEWNKEVHDKQISKHNDKQLTIFYNDDIYNIITSMLSINDLFLFHILCKSIRDRILYMFSKMNCINIDNIVDLYKIYKYCTFISDYNQQHSSFISHIIGFNNIRVYNINTINTKIYDIRYIFFNLKKIEFYIETKRKIETIISTLIRTKYDGKFLKVIFYYNPCYYDEHVNDNYDWKMLFIKLSQVYGKKFVKDNIVNIYLCKYNRYINIT